MALSNVRMIRASGNPARKILATTTFPRLINGNGLYVGAPALVEVAGSPMSNALLVDRFASLWQHSGSANIGGDTIFEIDLGSVRSIVAGGILGWTPIGTLAATNFGIEYLPGTTYSTSGWVADIPITGLLGDLTRDRGSVFAPRSARYWRFRFYSTIGLSGFFLSSFFLANSVADLGFLYARGDETIVTPKVVVEGYGGVPTITRTGGSASTFRRWALEYQNNSPADRQFFDTLNAETVPFIFLTPEDRVFETVFEGTDFNRANIWNPPDRYSFVVPLRSLP